VSAGPAEQARPVPGPLAALAAALVALLCALALPLVPQLQNVTTVQWPAPGAPAESTMLTLTPYRPLELHAVVPCSPAAPSPRVPLFATAPLLGPGAGLGLEVRLDEGRVRVTSAERTIWVGPVPTQDCLLRVDAVGDVTRVRVGDAQVAEVTVDPPQVAALATGLPPGTPGLTARLVADSRFETSPTLLKKVLIAVAVLAAAACLALLAARDPVRRRWSVPRPRVQDAVLLTVLGTWALIGPMLADDGFNVAVADGFADTGTVGNRYRWYNAPEAPFALVQQALVPLLELGRSPWLLRLPSVGAALATWLLLSRCLLPRLPGAGRAAQWLGLVAFLACWMPYDLGLRPEPWVALASTGVLVLVLRAVDTGRLLPLAVGGVLVALALACAPSGLLAAAPYVVLAPRLLPLLRDRGLPRPLVAATVCAPGAVTLVVAVFADLGLAALTEATRIHRVIGPTLGWWEEAERYRLLFSETDMGVFARRLSVLLLLGALLLLLASRRRQAAPVPDVLTVTALCTVFALGALVLTPSKWSHHFGALAGYGALLLAGTLLQAPGRLRREGGLAPAVVAALAAAALAAAGFAGPSLWVTYSSFGVPTRLPALLQSPLLWAALGAVAAVVSALPARPTARDVLPRIAGSTVALALVTSVVVMLGTFVQSASRLDGSWSMAGESLGHLRGAHCGMADHVLVLRPAALVAAAGTPSGSQSPPGSFRTGGGALPAPGNLPPEAPRWGTLRPPGTPAAEAGMGTLTSAWYAIPDRPRDAELGLAVSGRTSEGNQVALQYARRSDPKRVLLEQVVREDDADGVDWRYVTFGVTGPAADLVRVVVRDATTGRSGWVASSAPLLMRPSLLRDVLPRGGVSIDFPLSFAFPCADQVRVAHGLADLPAFGIAPRPDAAAEATATVEHSEPLGGTLAMAGAPPS
jgi:arabinosyltransferase C